MLASVIGLLLALAAGIDRLGGFGRFGKSARDDWTSFDHRSFLVSRVVDGDTIHVRSHAADAGKGETIVRLVGIDAPEMIDPATGRPAHWAERATRYVQGRAAGKVVSLRLEPVETRDRYDRLLAYVYLSDGDCLNLDLVRDGQAYAERRHRHSYRPQYEQAESEARRKKRGLWKDVTEQQMPPWRRVWLHRRDEPEG
jgi:micrococcal nuclease